MGSLSLGLVAHQKQHEASITSPLPKAPLTSDLTLGSVLLPALALDCADLSSSFYSMCQLDDGAGSSFFFPPSETDGDGNDKDSKVKLRTGMIAVSIFLFKQGCLKIVQAGLSKFHFRKTFATVSQRQIWVRWAEAETETASDKGKTSLAGCHCNQWISDPPPRYILEFIFQSVQAFSSLTQTNAHNCCYFLAAWGWEGNCNNSIHGGQLKPILALIPTSCVAHKQD